MNKGFTLIELMTSVAVFGFITAIVAGLFIYAVQIQRSILAQQKLLDEASFVMEFISRGLRVAEKAEDSACIPVDTNYELTHESSPGSGVWQGVKFLSPDPESDPPSVACRELFLDSTLSQLKESSGGLENVITSSAMEITEFQVLVTGNTPGDLLQPRVTISLELQRTGTKPEERPSIRLQTTVSQRNLDI